MNFLIPLKENVTRIVDLALKYKDHGVVGVDMAGDELLPLDQRHIDGFRRAKANGLHITVHAGESGPASNVRQVKRGKLGPPEIMTVEPL